MRDDFVIRSITKFVFIKSKLERADIIIVAGSGSKRVAKEVANIYKKKLADKFIFTGGFNETINEYESEFMKKIAIESGVDRKDIYLERRSTNTKENAIEALRIIKKEKLRYKTILVIGKPYHVLRLKMTFSKIFPKSKILVVPSKYDSLSKDNWWKTEWGRWRVMAEIKRVGEYYIKGDLSLE